MPAASMDDLIFSYSLLSNHLFDSLKHMELKQDFLLITGLILAYRVPRIYCFHYSFLSFGNGCNCVWWYRVLSAWVHGYPF